MHITLLKTFHLNIILACSRYLIRTYLSTSGQSIFWKCISSIAFTALESLVSHLQANRSRLSELSRTSLNCRSLNSAWPRHIDSTRSPFPSSDLHVDAFAYSLIWLVWQLRPILQNVICQGASGLGIWRCPTLQPPLCYNTARRFSNGLTSI